MAESLRQPIAVELDGHRLEEDNEQPRRAVRDLALEKQILADAIRRNC